MIMAPTETYWRHEQSKPSGHVHFVRIKLQLESKGAQSFLAISSTFFFLNACISVLSPLLGVGKRLKRTILSQPATTVMPKVQELP